MLTRRDLDILNFIEEYRIASTTTLTALFFPSLRSCQLRLRTLAVNGKVKRARLTMNHDYIYYVKKPGNFMHDLLVTEFYRELSQRSKILNFVSEKGLGKIRPDAIFGFEFEGKQRLGLLEVEISHKGFDFEKYEEFYRTVAYKEWFPIMPTVYIVGRNIKPPKTTQIKYVTIITDMSDFRL
jgi:hypothetical protein